MKWATKTVLLVLLLSAMGLKRIYAQNFTVGELNYSINDDAVSVTVTGHINGTSATGTLTIPESVNYDGTEYSVTSIGESAFYQCNGLTGLLTIPNSITSIGAWSFSRCNGFSGSLFIGNSVNTIGSGAFSLCNGLTGDLVIPNSVELIGDQAFVYCSGFSGNLIIGASVAEIEYSAFAGCDGFTGTLTLPYTITTIGSAAFGGCEGFTGSLTIPSSVTEIEMNPFSGCSGLEQIVVDASNPIYDSRENCNAIIETNSNTLVAGCQNTVIPNTVTSIGNYAFYGCSGFTGDLVIPNSVTTIGDYAFYGCSGFTGTLTLGNSLETIGTYAFTADNYGYLVGLNFTGDLVVPNSVTTIGYSAFAECRHFTGSLTIGNSVTTIGDSAFENCSGFTGSLTIGTGVTSIGEGAFKNCTGFTQVIYNAINCADASFGPLDPIYTPSTGPFLPFEGCGGTLTIGDNVERIPARMFYGCSGLTGNLTIPNSVTEIGDYAFCGCSGFTGTLTISNSVTTIGNSVFSFCHGFTGSLAIPNSVITIGNSAFSFCNGFTDSLTIPNSVTTIGNSAFEYCGGFTGSLTIGNSVTLMGARAFNNCIGFTQVKYNAINCADYFDYNPFDYPDIPNITLTGPFGGCGGTLIIGDNVERIPARMFYGCSGFTGNLVIPSSVTEIGDEAFIGCTGFTEFHSKNVTPPVLGSSVFISSGFQWEMVVFVPCGATEAYASAPGWSVFEYLLEEFVNLTVIANEDSLGRVSIITLGNCENPQCTVLATPYLGSMFVNWTINEVEVSTNAEYTFEATEDMNLIANFESIGNAYSFVGGSITNHWNDPDNWIPNELPTETSLVNVFADVEVNVDACVQGLAVYDDNVLTIDPDVTLTVTEILSSSASTSIVVENDGQLVHANEDALATVKRTITPYHYNERDGWHLIASPLASNVNISEIENLTANEYDLYYYDEPTHYWMNHKEVENAFNSLENGMGYLYGNLPPNETQVGADTSTMSYYPFNTWYKYGISESLFLAEELENVGLSNTPMISLSWYATNQTGIRQKNISIWMANVSENTLTTTSHNTSEMTWVYSGTMTPKIGWNEFVFNFGSFSWDGVSNILICVQRNDGAYSSAINWQSHDCGFDCMTYACRDGSNNSYNMLWQTYSMDISTSRANTIFKTLGGQNESVTLSFAGELENGSATINIPLSYTETAGDLKGFNLVGNPFAHNVTSYAATNVAEGCFRMNEAKDNLIVSEVSETQPLKPTEGFFVKATAEGASITFNDSRSRGKTSRKGFINLELSKDGKLIDRLIVKKDGEPLEKLTLKENGTRIFAMQGHQEIAIVPCAGNEQAVNFKAAKDSNYTITMNAESIELNYLHLIDNLTGNDVDLMVTPTYTFEAKTTDYASRFRLVFSSVCEDADDDNVESFAFISNGTIIVTGDYIDAMLQIVDMLGRVIVSTDVVHNVSTDGIASGVYVLRLVNGDIVKTQKIVIR